MTSLASLSKEYFLLDIGKCMVLYSSCHYYEKEEGLKIEECVEVLVLAYNHDA